MSIKNGCAQKCAWEFVILPVHGRKRQRRCPVDPWPVWWDVKQSPAGVWGWGVRRPVGWPGSTDNETDPCGTAPNSVPTGRSNRENDVKIVRDRFVIMQHKLLS